MGDKKLDREHLRTYLAVMLLVLLFSVVYIVCSIMILTLGLETYEGFMVLLPIVRYAIAIVAMSYSAYAISGIMLGCYSIRSESLENWASKHIGDDK